MVRKKKNEDVKTVDFGFKPSPYQEKIFDFIQNGTGNAVIKATAGSGKTTTLVSSMKLIPKSEKCMFIAFNNSIVNELKERLKDNKNCRVRTIHSLGLLMYRRNYGNDFEVDEYKYRTYLKNNIGDLTGIEEGTKMTTHMINDYIESISALIDYSRFNIAKTVEDVEKVADNYDIPVSFDECEVALKCLKWGRENIKTIDYTDMVWLPYELSMSSNGLQYDWIFFDEAQDATKMAIELFKKCFKEGTRFVSCGDSDQMINIFAGSSPEAFQFMIDQPNTTLFKLPVTYRCAKKITEFANAFVPEMQSREDAPDGEIISECSSNILKDGDMVLSRAKAPLMKLYTKLLRKNINCYIKGNDIGVNLIKTIESYKKEELNSDLSGEGLFVWLYDKLFDMRNKLIEKRGLDLKDATLSINVMAMYDSINALTILAEKCDTKSELIGRIRKIFKEESNGVCLSTVHKSKGLEADNVYILCNSTMPSKLAHRDWEKLQEKNLQYVAYTRAKNRLGFISEKEIKPCGSSSEPMEILNELKIIENKVCKILGKQPIEAVDNVEMARFNLRNVTKVEELHDDDNKIEVTIGYTNDGDTSKHSDEELLKELSSLLD